MEEKKYRVAVVGGAGTWGRYYTRACAEHSRCELVALVDRARERRERFAGHYGIPRTCDSIEELLAYEVPDIVTASIPVAWIHDTVVACAEAGVRAVSCEKPIDFQLSRADETVRICRERGTAFGCGTAHWGEPFLPETAAWLREVEWVEGVTHPPEPTYAAPEAEGDTEIDRPAYGRLGLSGGAVCEVLDPRLARGACNISVSGGNGRVWISRPRPVIVLGTGAAASPVFPEFLEGPGQSPGAMHMIRRAVDRLVAPCETGSSEVPCSGADYLSALEIAIALTHSAASGGERIELPLEDRSLKLYPHSYRLYGGDRAGWKSIGYSGPPDIAG